MYCSNAGHGNRRSKKYYSNIIENGEGIIIIRKRSQALKFEKKPSYSLLC